MYSIVYVLFVGMIKRYLYNYYTKNARNGKI